MRKSLLLPIALLGVLAGCTPGTSTTSSTTPPSTTTPVVEDSTSQETSVEDSSTGGNEGGEQTYTFEAEYVDLEGIIGGGISGSAAGVNMIMVGRSASNGYFVGFTHKLDLAITFTINSSIATTADLTLALGTELGPMQMNTTAFKIVVNDAEVNYTAFTIRANSSQTGTDFRDYNITPEINLVEGENTISLVTGTNEFCNGGPGGALYDCIKLTTESTLTWDPQLDNIVE